jgi:hypothetical protein
MVYGIHPSGFRSLGTFEILWHQAHLSLVLQPDFSLVKWDAQEMGLPPVSDPEWNLVCLMGVM